MSDAPYITIEPALDYQIWVARGDVLALSVRGCTKRVIIHPATNLDWYHVRLSEARGWITVKGFLSAQIKALELLGVKL